MDSQTEELFKKMAEQFIKLIESNNYLLQENLRLMQNTTNTTYPISSINGITPQQFNYIKRLISEGKIPKTQSLNITKTEAQILIHNAINSPIRKEENHIATTIPEMNEVDDY